MASGVASNSGGPEGRFSRQLTPVRLESSRADGQPLVSERGQTVADRRRVLLVEPEHGFRRLILQVCAPMADVQPVDDFQTARSALMEGTFDLLLTNVRLHAHNGLHLVYLALAGRLSTRALLYSDPTDAFLAKEAQRAGAFYEPLIRLPYSLPAYIQAKLPPEDRRDPDVADRRAEYRGGRRRSDVHLTGSARLLWV